MQDLDLCHPSPRLRIVGILREHRLYRFASPLVVPIAQQILKVRDMGNKPFVKTTTVASFGTVPIIKPWLRRRSAR